MLEFDYRYKPCYRCGYPINTYKESKSGQHIPEVNNDDDTDEPHYICTRCRNKADRAAMAALIGA